MRVFAALFLLTLLAGCTSYASRTYGTPAPARGKVLLANGQPARGLRVIFTPTDGQGYQDFADTGADGTFAFGAGGQGPQGVVPGHYVVLFEKSPNARAAAAVPRKFTDTDTSIKVEVKAGEDNVFAFRLQ